MNSIATSVRVSPDAYEVLNALSDKMGRSKAQVVELALRRLEEQTFWSEFHAAFNDDGAVAQGIRDQAAEWDATVGDGLASEPAWPQPTRK